MHYPIPKVTPQWGMICTFFINIIRILQGMLTLGCLESVMHRCHAFNCLWGSPMQLSICIFLPYNFSHKLNSEKDDWLKIKKEIISKQENENNVANLSGEFGITKSVFCTLGNDPCWIEPEIFVDFRCDEPQDALEYITTSRHAELHIPLLFLHLFWSLKCFLCFFNISVSM